MSYYVKRTRPAQPSDPRASVIGGRKIGWTGPIRSEKQANREAAAWSDGGWSGEVIESTPDTRREVREWQKARNAERGR
jgi:hypothetical protein